MNKEHEQTSIDLLIQNALVIPMDEDLPRVFKGDVAVNDGRIVSAAPSGHGNRFNARKRIDASGKICLPGFIDTHTHLFQVLLKGLGRDKPLLEWLDSSVRRAIKYITPEMIGAAASVGLLDALRSGTSTVVDYQYCHGMPGLDEAVIEEYRRLGVRGVLARGYTNTAGFPEDVRPEMVEREEQFIEETESLARKYRGNDMMNIAAAPGIIWDLTKQGFEAVRDLSERWGMTVTMHVMETPDDNQYAEEQLGMETMQFLDSIGLLTSRFHGVHGVYLSRNDLRLSAERGISIAHAPISNMILASGNAPVREMLELGIPVSLCCDGPASNDSQDMYEVIKAASMVHKMVSGDASAVPAYQVLKMATIDGARAVGMEKMIGSITPGKRADIQLLDPRDVKSAPMHDPVHMIVYAGGRHLTDTLIIDGNVVMEQGAIASADESLEIERVQEMAELLVHKAGLAPGWKREMERA